MCVTSPPYFGLRSYLPDDSPDKPLEIGLEETPDQYIERMVEVFRCVRDVLADDGTLWLNIGDTYATQGGAHGGRNDNQSGVGAKRTHDNGGGDQQARRAPNGLKPKDLIGIPWMLAFALRADGWVLRQDIVWSKPNPMPESVKDRCTKSHEMIFLLSKAKWIGDMPPRRMKKEDARWLAILLEAEGNIAIRRYTHKRETPQHALQIAIANSDITILQEAQRIAGCGSILTAKGCNRPVHYLQWTTKEAADLLWEMYPFMFGKKRQAAIGLMLEARRSNKNKGVRDDIFTKEGRHFYLKPEEIELREKMWSAVKSLNKHEPVDLSWLVEPKEGRWDSQPYFFDADAIKEPAVSEKPAGNKRHKYADAYAAGTSEEHRTKAGLVALSGVEWETRNRRSVWTVATRQYRGAHFATFPPALIEPCILAGSRPGDIVLDPFIGSGTTAQVALQHGRQYRGCELNPEYGPLQAERIAKATPAPDLFTRAQSGAETEPREAA